MTVVVPLSAFFMIISEFDLNSLSALRSLKGKLLRALLRNFSLFQLYSPTSVIQTPKGQSKLSVLERCPYKIGHYDDVTFMTSLTVLTFQ